MIAARSRWLPREAAADVRVPAPVVERFEDWRRHWIAAPHGLTLRTTYPAPMRREAACEGRASVVVGDAGRRALGAAMLGLAEAALAEADHEVLAALADEALDDLRARIEALIGDAAGSCTGSHGGAVAFGAYRDPATHTAPWFIVTIGAGDVAAIVCDALPPVTGLAPLGRIEQAMAGVGVELFARVGHSAIPLAEVEALAVGDVLLLDHPVDRPLPILLARDGPVLTHGKIVDVGGAWALAVSDSDVAERAA